MCSSTPFAHTEPSVTVILNREQDNKILMLRKFRSQTNQYYWELPGGTKKKEEHNIIETVVREVLTTTGFRLKTVRLLTKGPSLLDLNKSDENYYVAIATICNMERVYQEIGKEEQIIWMDEKEVFKRLKRQIEEGEYFYSGDYVGSSIYALITHKFLQK